MSLKRIAKEEHPAERPPGVFYWGRVGAKLRERPGRTGGWALAPPCPRQGRFCTGMALWIVRTSADRAKPGPSHVLTRAAPPFLRGNAAGLATCANYFDFGGKRGHNNETASARRKRSSASPTDLEHYYSNMLGYSSKLEGRGHKSQRGGKNADQHLISSRTNRFGTDGACLSHSLPRVQWDTYSAAQLLSLLALLLPSLCRM